MKLTRQVMHDLVWSFPTIRVAKALGISGSSLAKTCERRGIPTPNRGYWQRLRVGHETLIPPLTPVDFELPLPWNPTPELYSLLQERQSFNGAVGGQISDSEGAAESEVAAFERALPEPVKAPESEPGQPTQALPVRETGAEIGVAPEDAASMAALVGELQACEQLCEEVLRIARRQPIEVAELLEAWVQAVRRSCRERDPFAALVASCTRVARDGAAAPSQGNAAGSGTGR